MEPGSYKLVTLDAVTKKEIKAKKGREIYFALKSPRGKIHRIESEYSQPFSQSDFRAIETTLRQSSPAAFPVYQQVTRSPAFHYEGKKKIFEYRTKDGAPLLDKRGKPLKRYRYKLTGKKSRSKQRTVVMGITGYVHSASVGFTKKASKETATSFKLLPIGRHKVSADIVLKGETIHDTIRTLRPALSSRDMVKRGIHRLGVHGFVTLVRPKNPYKKSSPEFIERDTWMRKIWGNNQSIQVAFNRIVDRLANFSDAISVAIREALSRQGLRVTSLIKLTEIEGLAMEQDEVNRVSGRRFRKTAGKIIDRPSTDRKGGADTYLPLRPENEFNAPVHKNNSKYNAGISVSMTIEGLK